MEGLATVTQGAVDTRQGMELDRLAAGQSPDSPTPLLIATPTAASTLGAEGRPGSWSVLAATLQRKRVEAAVCLVVHLASRQDQVEMAPVARAMNAQP